MEDSSKVKKILVIGAGFAGVSLALNLYHRHLRGVKITVVSPDPHFEYHGALYRVVSGRSPMETCIPINEIFSNYKINFSQDYITSINFQDKYAVGRSSSTYYYDYLVITIGSEASYFDIQGLRELSFGLRSTRDALRLNKHLHDVFLECAVNDKIDKTCNTHFIIVGGGASGVEIAGELALYCKKLAKKHLMDESYVTIDLISSGSRLVPEVSTNMSYQIKKRLSELGVNIFLKRKVMKEEIEEVFLKDMKMRSKTVIWAAGTRGSSQLTEWGLPVTEKGVVIVDKFLRPKFTGPVSEQPQNQSLPHIPTSSERSRSLDFGSPRSSTPVFIAGDSAATAYSGLAETALYDGNFIAENIARLIKKEDMKTYKPKDPIVGVPVGPNWAAVKIGKFEFFGKIGWMLRRFIEFRFFSSILPLKKAFVAFNEEGILSADCPICSK